MSEGMQEPEGSGSVESQPAMDQQAVTDKDSKTWGLLCHLVALAGFIIPFGNIVGPLVIWLIKKDEMPFVDDQGKESLNFQISMTIYTLIAGLLIFAFIGFVLLPAVAILNLVFIVIASVKANQGIRYRYPLCIRLIK